MALTPDFSVNITPGEPETLNFTDNSSGTDETIVSRNIYIQKDDGAFIVLNGNTQQYEVWEDFPDTTTKTLENILDKDYACRVVVEWVNGSNTVVYSKERYLPFTGFNEDFDYSLTQIVQSNQLLINDNNFWANKSLLRTLIDSGNNAVNIVNDISSAQSCYNIATNLRLNSQYYFNQNS